MSHALKESLAIQCVELSDALKRHDGMISIQDCQICCSQHLPYEYDTILLYSLQASLREIQVFTGGTKQVMLTTTTTDINGEFCVMLALGEYMVKVRPKTPTQSYSDKFVLDSN